MDKLKMQTTNKADENFRALVAMFPNAVTEIIDESGEVVRAIDKDVLMQEISAKVVEGKEERYQFTWPDKKKAMLAANAPIGGDVQAEVNSRYGLTELEKSPGRHPEEDLRKGRHHPGLLGHGDEVLGADRLAVGTGPADQGLDPAGASAPYRHDGLEHNPEILL